MTKRRRFSDDERATYVAMLVAEGYPTRVGALLKVSSFAGIHTNVLRRWWKGTQNPPPTQLVIQKKAEIGERIEGIVHQVLDLLPDALELADARELITALGVSVDKLQLVKGHPTERIATDDATSNERRLAEIVALYDAVRARTMDGTGPDLIK